MPECWPGRVPLCPPSLCQAAGASGQGRRGQEGRVSSGCSLSSGTHGGWQCVQRSVCLSSWLFTVLVGVPRPHTTKLPGRGSWGLQWAAAMRSQGNAGGSPRQAPAWVGRGSRKVLRVWVSAWGPGGWVKPCSRGAGQVQYRPQATGAPGGGLEDTLHPPQPPAAAAARPKAQPEQADQPGSAERAGAGHSGQRPPRPQPVCLLGGPRGPAGEGGG